SSRSSRCSCSRPGPPTPTRWAKRPVRWVASQSRTPARNSSSESAATISAATLISVRPVHRRGRRRPLDEVPDDGSQLLGPPPASGVDDLAVLPPVSDADLPAGDLEHAPGDIAGVPAGEPDHQG